MSKYKVILFDLDGTLSDPKEGITKSVQYALQKLNIIEPDLNKLNCFIGPPLQESFAQYYHLEEQEIQKAIDYYRERFQEKGMFENILYPSILELLKDLKNAKKILVVATSKPTIFSKEILKYFSLDHYFDLVVGSHLDGTRSAKVEIIQYIINTYSQYDLDEFIMIGDRKHDVIGAQQTGIDSIGVTYGYGSKEELGEYNPTYLLECTEQIKEIIIG
jgi:phosphoglycolate phosphatase